MVTTCPVAAAELRRILDDACRLGAERAALLDEHGEQWMAIDTVLPGDGAAGSAQGASQRDADIHVRGRMVGTVRVSAVGCQVAHLEQVAHFTASRVGAAWATTDEIDSLAAELLRAYSEMDLLYSLGESLTTDVDVAEAVGQILERTLAALNAEWALLTLQRPGGAAEYPLGPVPTSPGADEAVRQGEHAIRTTLRSGGQTIGTISVGRWDGAESFTSVEAKLLDAVATLAGNGIRNAQMFQELRQQGEALREREVHLRAVLENVADALITLDEEGRIASFNPAAVRIFDTPLYEALGQPIGHFVPDAQRGGGRGIRQSLRTQDGQITGPALREAIGRRRDGAVFPIELTASEMHLDSRRLFILSVRDVTERQRAQEALTHQALHDSLTNLPNRVLLHDRLEQLVALGRRTGTPFSLLVMDLDRFKDVNDALGHHCGDLLLQQASGRLQSVLRETDTLARLGGDEFAVLLPGADTERATHVGRRLLRTLDDEFLVEGNSVSVGGSVGIALYPAHADDAHGLLRMADAAMYVAKRANSGLAIYTPDLHGHESHGGERLALFGELRRALEHDELTLLYQPKFDCVDQQVACVEALVRWQHPQRGLLTPDKFIPLAEETGLIGRLSRWVLNEALRQCASWHAAGRPLSVAVNLSMRDMQDAELPEAIGDLLETHGLNADALVVEITESSLMADPTRAMDVVGRLGGMGVRVSIDDFGTGYSSLSYLHRLPVHEIKIDKGFVQHMLEDEGDSAIVRATILLGHDLGLGVVAEGVENRDTHELLVKLGCDTIQGYFVGRPMAPDALTLWLGLRDARVEELEEAHAA